MRPRDWEAPQLALPLVPRLGFSGPAKSTFGSVFFVPARQFVYGCSNQASPIMVKEFETFHQWLQRGIEMTREITFLVRAEARGISDGVTSRRGCC